jgi:hypothetical protein
MYYSDAALKDLAEAYRDLGHKHYELVKGFTTLRIRNPRAQEFARQGFPRRVKVMVRCIENVFEHIPPERTDLPSRDELTEATINIQSFVFNTFGAADNLAWIWVAENGQKRADGTPIPNRHIGLGPDNLSVRASLSQELQAYLKTLDPWFARLADLRHALAHRIPLYIPPYVITPKDEGAYREFDSKMIEAAGKGDVREYDRLSTEQMRLGRFRPWVQHSFEEGATPVVFHPQMLADFATIHELANKLLGEFASPRSD